MKRRNFLRLTLGALGAVPVLAVLSKQAQSNDDVILTHNGISLRISGDLSKVRLGRQPDGIVYVIAPRGSTVSREGDS